MLLGKSQDHSISCFSHIDGASVGDGEGLLRAVGDIYARTASVSRSVGGDVLELGLRYSVARLCGY